MPERYLKSLKYKKHNRRDLMIICYEDSNLPLEQDYYELINSTGWLGIVEKGKQEIIKAISNSWYLICAYEGNKLVGSGRVLSDGVYQAFICDLIVLPGYQGKGVGKEILLKLLKRCNEQDILMVSLFAAKEKSNYYKKFGFEDRPQDSPGMRWMNRDIF
jgi:N-acetylglutamate synthase-like GNAT family acetyltransferase